MEQTTMDLIWKRDSTIPQPVLKIVKLNAKVQQDVNIGPGIQVSWAASWKIYSTVTYGSNIILDYNSACWKKTDKGDKFQSVSMVSGPKYCGDLPEPNPNKI